MPIREADTGLGAATKEVAEHAGAIARLEAKLALAELKGKLAALGLGVGILVGAAIFGLFTLGFAAATIAAGLATTLPIWLALAIVTGGLLTFTASLAVLGLRAIKKGTPPIPEQAIEEAKLATQAVTSNGKY